MYATELFRKHKYERTLRDRERIEFAATLRDRARIEARGAGSSTRALDNLRTLRGRPYSHFETFTIRDAAAMVGCGEEEIHKAISRGTILGAVEIGDGHYRTAYPEHEKASHIQAVAISWLISRGRTSASRREERSEV